MYIKRSKLNELIIKTIVISLFLVPYYFRVNTLKDLASIKLIFVALLPIFLINNIRKIDKSYFFIVSIIIIYISINNILINGNEISSNIRTLFICIVPIYLMTVDLKLDERSSQNIFKSVLKIFNFFTILIIIVGILDPLINYKIMGTIGNELNNKFSEIITKSINRDIYRYSSYLGHYLFTKDISIFFYILNTCYYKYFKEKLLNRNIVIIISLVGVLLTGSKSGVVILLCMIVLINGKRNKIINMISSLFIVAIAYAIGFFNTFLSRINSGNLTTGRGEAWEILKEYGIYTKKIFFGYGEYYIESAINIVGNTRAVAAFEYPIRIFIYKYGILVALLIILVLFIYPIIRFLKNKSYTTAILFTLMFININTYNGLVLTPDNMIFYSMFSMLLMNCCYYENSNSNI